MSLRKMNKIGYCEFLLDMKKDKSIKIVSEYRTKELPSGDFISIGIIFILHKN